MILFFRNTTWIEAQSNCLSQNMTLFQHQEAHLSQARYTDDLLIDKIMGKIGYTLGVLFHGMRRNLQVTICHTLLKYSCKVTQRRDI